MNTALTIAGSDSCAGAGVQADLKTFHAHGVYGLTAITAVTVQNTQKVWKIQELSPEIVRDQILCLFEDINIKALKIGMVYNESIIDAIDEAFHRVRLPDVVLDPILVSTDGYKLLQTKARQFLIKRLFPWSNVVTPNLPEACLISGHNINNLKDMKIAAKIIYDMGPDSVIVKGGHLKEGVATDIFFDGRDFSLLSRPFIRSQNTHGTGCTYSAAITANLALGYDLITAFERSKVFISNAIYHSLDLGKGHGPVNQYVQIRW